MGGWSPSEGLVYSGSGSACHSCLECVQCWGQDAPSLGQTQEADYRSTSWRSPAADEGSKPLYFPKSRREWLLRSSFVFFFLPLVSMFLELILFLFTYDDDSRKLFFILFFFLNWCFQDGDDVFSMTFDNIGTEDVFIACGRTIFGALGVKMELLNTDRFFTLLILWRTWQIWAKKCRDNIPFNL